MWRKHGTKGPEVVFQCFEEKVPRGLLGMKRCVRVRLIVGLCCTLPTRTGHLILLLFVGCVPIVLCHLLFILYFNSLFTYLYSLLNFKH